jgi:hypothetical protein
MLEQNIRYRAAIYAALYTPPMSISRQTATSLYNDLAERGFQKLGFEYTPPDEDKSFSILMVEKGEGRRADSIQIDILQGSLRLLFNQTWPDSFDVACKKADQVALAITNVLTGCQIRLIEARIRSQVAIPERSGNEYLMSRLMPGKKDAIAGLVLRYSSTDG